MSDRLPFAGDTYDDERDHDRLASQLMGVRAALADGQWHTLAQLATATGYPEASISARIRDLRKPEFQQRLGGNYQVQADPPEAGGTWHYRLITITVTTPETSMSTEPTTPNDQQPPETEQQRQRRRNAVTVSISDETKAICLLLGKDPEALITEAVSAHVASLRQRMQAAAA